MEICTGIKRIKIFNFINHFHAERMNFCRTLAQHIQQDREKQCSFLLAAAGDGWTPSGASDCNVKWIGSIIHRLKSSKGRKMNSGAPSTQKIVFSPQCFSRRIQDAIETAQRELEFLRGPSASQDFQGRTVLGPANKEYDYSQKHQPHSLWVTGSGIADGRHIPSGNKGARRIWSCRGRVK